MTDHVKTARKPYDRAVCALLLIAYNIDPDNWSVESDGDQEEWRPATELVELVYPDQVLIPDTIRA